MKQKKKKNDSAGRSDDFTEWMGETATADRISCVYVHEKQIDKQTTRLHPTKNYDILMCVADFS